MIIVMLPYTHYFNVMMYAFNVIYEIQKLTCSYPYYSMHKIMLFLVMNPSEGRVLAHLSIICTVE